MVMDNEKMEKSKVLRPSKKKLLIYFFTATTFLILFLVNLRVDITPFIINYSTRITQDSGVGEYLRKEVDTAHVSVFLFNITNLDAFVKQEDPKLKLQEVGPFTYIERRWFENLEMDPEPDVMRYTPQLNLVFSEKESIGRPEDVIVTMPNIPMLGVTANIQAYSSMVATGFSYFASLGLSSKVAVTTNAQSYMWGYKDSLVSIGNIFAPGRYDFNKMGILDRLYDNSVKDNMEIYTTKEKKFMIKSINGHTKLGTPTQDPDDCEECSLLKDTYEGYMYPTFLTPEFPLRLYRHGLCRILEMQYRGKKNMDYGGEGLIYTLSDDFLNSGGENSSGVLEVSECFFGMPLSLSKPHFLDADPKLYDRIEGISPDRAKHDSYAVLEPTLGIELETVISIQINLILEEHTNKNTVAFSNMTIPICYIKLAQSPLPDDCIQSLKLIYNVLPVSIRVTQILLLLATSVSWVYFIFLLRHYWIYPEQVLDCMTLHVPTAADKHTVVITPEYQDNNNLTVTS